MIRDEDLKSSVDYSEGQKRAAHRVLVELVNIFQEYEDEIRVIGGLTEWNRQDTRHPRNDIRGTNRRIGENENPFF